MCTCESCRRKAEADRKMWQGIRRGLLAIVKSIDNRYAEPKPQPSQDRRAA